MIGHLIRLVWNRKRSNALLAVEIFISTLVLSAIVITLVFFADAWRKPLGFDYENVWRISVRAQGVGVASVSQTTTGDSPAAAPEKPVRNDRLELFERLLHEVEGFEEVEAAAGAQMGPYDIGSMTSTFEREGREVRIELSDVTDRFDVVMKLDLIRGRWFAADDSATAWRPMVIDLETARLFYANDDPVGQVFIPASADGSRSEARVVGVVSDYRRSGELGLRSNFVFRRIDLRNDAASVPSSMFIRVRPGTGAAFEEQLLRRMLAVAPGWSFEVTPLDRARESMFRTQLMPVVIGGTIVLFLLLMVSFGLIGVLWQTVTQRRSELALRRAVGATREAIGRHVVLEMLVVASTGILAAALLVVQAPALGILGFMAPGVFAAGVILSLLLMVLLVIGASLYPGFLATRVEPALALRSE
jgi:putative ABC transport system permease protein